MKLKIHNCEITISYTLICLAGLCIILGIFGGFVLCLLAVIIHESGHLSAMLMLSKFPERIKVSLFEISIVDSRRTLNSTINNFIIIFFGPFASFICFILFYLLYLLCNFACLEFAYVNLFTGLFNMLPVISLDGGQMMLILLLKKLNLDAALRAVNITTFVFIFPLSALGFILLFNTGYNFSLIAVSLYLIMALICKKDAF